MFPYIDDIFHARVCFSQACCTCDLKLRCHFELGFIVNSYLHDPGTGLTLPSEAADDHAHGPGVTWFHPGV